MSSSMSGYTGPTGSMSRRGSSAGDVIPKGYRSGQVQQFTPEQMDLFRQLFSHVGPDSYLSRLAGGEEGMFDEMEAPAMRQFSALQGNLASRFSNMGSGSRRSSGFQNTISQASSDFAQDLQSRRQELQRQAIKDLLGLSSDLLGQRPQERIVSPKRKKRTFAEELLFASAPAFFEGLGSGIGGGGGGGGGGAGMAAAAAP